MKIKVLFFAGCQDAVGKKETEIDIEEGTTVERLLDKILRDYPVLEPLRKNLMLAVNTEYVSSDTVLQDGDEFAFIPPVSGGQDV
jgi:molybdopterin converting factor subunit 1